MIMAGRGKRLVEVTVPQPKVGSILPLSEDATYYMQILIQNINEINVLNVSLSQLKKIKQIFCKPRVSEEQVKNTVISLYEKAISDAEFGKKLVVAMQPLLKLYANDLPIRSVLLNSMQENFESKNQIFKSNKIKFLNSTKWLGYFYCISSYSVLGIPLIESFEMLINDEECIKLLIEQIIINNQELSACKRSLQQYDNFKRLLRNKLLEENLSKTMKCWILLTIECTLSNSTLPTGSVKEFYASNLGKDYSDLETAVQESKQFKKECSFLNLEPSPTYVVIKNMNMDVNRSHSNKNSCEDSQKKIENLNVKKPNEHNIKGKGKNTHSKNFKFDDQKVRQKNEKSTSNSKGYSVSEHDDRFEKDKNFYGAH